MDSAGRTPEPGRGLDPDGFILREGDLARVQPRFTPLVHRYAAAARETFGADLHSVLLYGSIPRGTARAGVSDLDGQVLLTGPPGPVDRSRRDRLEQRLALGHPEVSGVGILLDGVGELTHPAQRHDGGFHLRVLCTPLWGPDPGAAVPPHRPDLALARAVQGDWRGALTRLREAAGQPPLDPAAAALLTRSAGRRLTRLAFTWVMPRWGGWTSDPAVVRQVVERLEPSWAAPLTAAVRFGWPPERAGADRGQPGPVVDLLAGFGGVLWQRGEELGA